jgi:hypothetical protein
VIDLELNEKKNEDQEEKKGMIPVNEYFEIQNNVENNGIIESSSDTPY